MAETAETASTSTTQSTVENSFKEQLNEIREIVWGRNIKLDVFQRWSQGFEFSPYEPSALVQRQGGPCAVIAPVQAFLLKSLLSEADDENFSELTADKCKSLLIDAICSILTKCKNDKYSLVILPQEDIVPSNEVPDVAEAQQLQEQETQVPAEASHMMETDANASSVSNETIWVPDEFHERLSVLTMDDIDQVKQFYTNNFRILTSSYGVIKFMYSVLLTKNIKNEMSQSLENSEALIHDTHGSGSQILINLMLTGEAVPYVWDGDTDAGGLKLRGLSQQSDIGFLTAMEQYRYVAVGSFYKNPKNPIWVLASEEHLTVLFGHNKALAPPETRSEMARRVFKSYDPDGNNFIPSAVLQNVLFDLDLVNEPPEYVEIMNRKLDPEGLGIILLNAFMDEFFPEEKRSTPDIFDLWHYNGIVGSNADNKVQYHKGNAVVGESDLRLITRPSPMLSILESKWPQIDVNWLDSRTPSLN